jgi:hypothetical protein
MNTLIGKLLGNASLVGIVVMGCATASNTLAQDLAWERIDKCRDASLNVILDRVDPDGRVWVQLRNGTAGLADWQACMRRAELEQASARRDAARPAGPPSPPASGVSAAIDRVPPPSWAVGEEWAYRWESPEGKGTYIESIVRLDRVEGIDCYVLKSGSSEMSYRATDMALVREARSSGATVSVPPRPQFDWPLHVGKRWEQTVNTENRADRTSRETRWVWEITAVETVTVPAGTFETLRIVASNQRNGALIYEMWYAPAVKWWVRMRLPLRAGVQERELIGFRTRAG